MLTKEEKTALLTRIRLGETSAGHRWAIWDERLGTLYCLDVSIAEYLGGGAFRYRWEDGTYTEMRHYRDGMTQAIIDYLEK